MKAMAKQVLWSVGQMVGSTRSDFGDRSPAWWGNTSLLMLQQWWLRPEEADLCRKSAEAK